MCLYYGLCLCFSRAVPVNWVCGATHEPSPPPGLLPYIKGQQSSCLQLPGPYHYVTSENLFHFWLGKHHSYTQEGLLWCAGSISGNIQSTWKNMSVLVCVVVWCVKLSIHTFCPDTHRGVCSISICFLSYLENRSFLTWDATLPAVIFSSLIKYRTSSVFFPKLRK